MSEWVLGTIIVTFFLGCVSFLTFAVYSVVDEISKNRVRQRMYDSASQAFGRKVLNLERTKSLASIHNLTHCDIKTVISRLHEAVLVGKIERSEPDDILELETLIKQLDDEDPFNEMPPNLKASLQRISNALGPNKDALDNLRIHLKDYSRASIRERRRSYLIGIIGVALSAIGVALTIWLK